MNRVESMFDNFLSFVDLPPPEEIDLDPPDLKAWTQYIEQGGNPHVKCLGYPFVWILFNGLVWGAYDNQLPQFATLVDLLLHRGADFNFKKQEFYSPDEIKYYLRKKLPITEFCEEIKGDKFSMLSCFHKLYLFWKLRKWDKESSKLLKDLFYRMLNHPSIDVRDTFSEEYTARNPDWDNRRPFEDDYEVSLRNVLEKANLLHYATVIGDTDLVQRLLDRDPDLMHSTCFSVMGKNLLSTMSLRKICKKFYTETPGVIAFVGSKVKENLVANVERVTQVTPLHIAAREGNLLLCGLFAQRAFRGAIDSEGQTPYDYLKRAFEGWKMNGGYTCDGVQRNFLSELDFHNLSTVLKYRPIADRPLPQAFQMIHHKNYSIYFDNKTRVAAYVYECLKAQDLKKKAHRGNQGFVQDKAVPVDYRASTNDYTNTGYDRGHMRPAEDAVKNKEAMSETFKLTNVFPQNPSLNRGYWTKLEERIRKIVKKSICVEIFTGPLYLPKDSHDNKKYVKYRVIGKSAIACPTHCFKVIFAHKKNTIKQYAYCFPNRDISPGKRLNEFEVTVEEIQKLSGIMFNTRLPTS